MKGIGLSVTLLFVFITACAPHQTAAPSSIPLSESTSVNTWEGLPIFPGAVEVRDNRVGYHYTVANADILTIQRFYKNETPTTGWELLSITDASGADIGKAWSLLFTKGKIIAQVDIFTKENITHVVLSFD